MRFTLRPYQQEAVETARELLRRGKRAVLIVAPTGAGKTVIACHIIENSMIKGNRTLFFAHRKELIDQCSAKLDEIGVPHGIIKAGNRRVDSTALVQIASVQTLARRLEKIRQDFRLIIIDEAHHARAGQYAQVLAANPEAIILGLTATPYRADGKGLGEVFDAIVEVASINELIEGGFLVKPRTFIGRRVSLAGVKTTAGEYNLKQLAEAVDKPKLVGHIVNSWKQHAADRLTVCFTVGIAHSKSLAQQFSAAGIAADHLDGTTPEDKREQILARFAEGWTRVLCNCAVLTEGWDCPPVSAIILARPTKSRALWRQMSGRVLRIFDGKTDCLILDHGNCTQTHGFLTDPDTFDLSEGTSGDRVRPTRRCGLCGAKYAGAPAFCPQCGAVLQGDDGERLDEALAGDASYEMFEAGPGDVQRKKKRPIPPHIARDLYFNDLQTAKARGYRPGWADARYKSRIGHWPGKEIRDEAPLKTRFVKAEDGKMIKVFAVL